MTVRKSNGTKSQPSSLDGVLTARAIKQLADDRSFQRGEAYAAHGRVGSIVVLGDTLTAMVSGTHDYTVALTVVGGQLIHRCSCPVGLDGSFCKHAVATALAWLDASGRKSSSKNSTPADAVAPLVQLDDLHPWLTGQSPAKLADLLLDVAARDDRLRERLIREAARTTGKGLDFSAYRKSIDRATRTGGFVDYYKAGNFARRIREAIEPLHELLREGYADEVIVLAEHALKRVERALENADDSDGVIHGQLEELQELHREACRVARPDPEALAVRLFDWEVSGSWEVFYCAAEKYADILGPEGLAVYRELAETEWKKLPALTPGMRKDYDSRRFHVTSIMEALARIDGDVDTLVSIKANDLSHPYAFLQIAELYRDAKREDEALVWAERGLKAFPEDPDSRLVEFVAAIYHRRKRHEEAMELVWRLFEKHPSLEGYQKLKTHATRAKAWPDWRERALATLRERIANADRGHRARVHPWEIAGHRSTLVRVFLWEKDVENAWREAHAGDIPRGLWLELARAREPDHPADAVPILIREAEALIAETNKRSYEAAVGRLREVKALHRRLAQTEEWTALLARLRLQHKAKRNFIALAANL